MILGFHEYFDKKKTQPTNFREKILSSSIMPYDFDKPEFKELLKIKLDIHQWMPKIHTFRVDQFDRWKAGMSIQMVYRGPKYSIKSHFNKGIPELEKCKSTQKVEIKWVPLSGIAIVPPPVKEMRVWVDGRRLTPLELNVIAINDGFPSIHEFGKYFNKDVTMKIIHWTDIRY